MHLGFALFLFVVFVVPDLLWWRWADRRVRERRWARVVLGLFMAWMLAQVVTMMFLPQVGYRAHLYFPVSIVSANLMWHLMLLPLTIVVSAVGSGVARLRTEPVATDSRRGFLAGVIALGPPLATALAVGVSMPRLRSLRVRELDVPVPGLPPALDGAVIAHVSDPHFGKFTDQSGFDAAVDAVNAMKPDLILHTGDLIDLSIDDLPDALAWLDRFERPEVMFLCEGNHDLIEDGARFRTEAAESEFQFLIGDAETVKVRGQRVQILGAPWMGSVRDLDSLKDPDAFRILLAHHPHVFDEAEGYPLMLAGHTHGGQLNLNDEVGFGALMYRYWSGLYTRPDRSLVVSNGVGHWFPVRTAAPAEVLKLTLRATA